ncbi:hypothetical protein LCGC14_0457990 [marine sediment metagenome]|uniref:dATP/dGTP diphosphohydrolase N-terminal domain-containing protein n=1 Tax=marine sediment metagenome TaxID=412755 RepID=A0A0F9V2Q8_9ZZZZ
MNESMACFRCSFETSSRPDFAEHWRTAPNHQERNEAGRKDDQEKLRLDLLSVPALRGLAAVLTHGAKKYDDRNWEKGIKFSRVYGAVLRHLLAWWDHEDDDPESGLLHLDHALCGLMFLSHYEHGRDALGLGYDDWDDRP